MVAAPRNRKPERIAKWSMARGDRYCTQAAATSADARLAAIENGMNTGGTGPSVRWKMRTATGMNGHQRQPCTINAPMAMPAGGQISVTCSGPLTNHVASQAPAMNKATSDAKVATGWRGVDTARV